MIRELHVYGQVATLATSMQSDNTTQHTGIGRQLMQVAELIANQSGYEFLSVISGVGVR